MLNLILHKKLYTTNKDYNNENKIKTSKHFPSSTREWKDSIYVYNKNNLNLIPTTDIISTNIIKSYFSIFNKNIEKKLRTKRLSARFRKLSSNNIYISNGEFKHTNNKVIINLYIFNRQNKNYSLIMNKVKAKLLFFFKNSKKKLIKRIKFLEKETLSSFFLDKIFLIEWLENVKKNKRINNYIIVSIQNYCKKLINNEKKKRLVYWYYKQISFINKYKHTYVYLQYLKEHLTKLYNKQVEFNLINIKRFYLNSDILLESITKKITKNRRKMSRFLTKLKNKVKIKKKNSYLHKYIINNKLDEKKILTKSTNSLKKAVIKNLKYKDVTGFRLEAKGRLTKRYTASRSLSKVKYNGNLLNIDSSLKGLSSVLLKGNLKSNVQFTKLASKSRIGSFGMKGWISGY